MSREAGDSRQRFSENTLDLTKRSRLPSPLCAPPPHPMQARATRWAAGATAAKSGPLLVSSPSRLSTEFVDHFL